MARYELGRPVDDRDRGMALWDAIWMHLFALGGVIGPIVWGLREAGAAAAGILMAFLCYFFFWPVIVFLFVSGQMSLRTARTGIEHRMSLWRYLKQKFKRRRREPPQSD